MADDHQPVVKITLDEIYKTLTEVKGLVEGMGSREAGVTKRMDSHSEDLDDHETRIRSLEKWRYAIPATVAVVALELVRSFMVGG